MFENYIKTALRSVLKHKANAIINVAGLTIGFSAFLFIFLVINYQKSFDVFHKNENSIYRVVRIGKNPENREYRAGVPFPVTRAMRADFPQLANAAAIYGDRDVQVTVTSPDGATLKKFKEEKGVFVAEPQFFKMFDFSLAEGSIDKALNAPNQVLVTRDIAAKYFGDAKKAIGKTLKLYGQVMNVTGVLNNPPVNTDFPLKVVVSYATLEKMTDMNDWGSISDNNYCFIQLHEKSSMSRFDNLLSGFTEAHIKPVNPGYDLALQPLKEMHYDERYGNFNGRTFGKDLIFALSLIGLFLIIIACVNFINLSTAQAANRAREVGVRKVLGGNRHQLVLQFLGETGIATFVALSGSLLIVFLGIPSINNLLDIHLSASELFTPALLLFMFGAFILITFLSGFYPALVLSRFKPAIVLKSAVGTDSSKGILFRRSLVVFQFVIAQVLILGTLIVASQMDYFRKSNLGFNKDAVINAAFPGDSLSRTKIDFLKEEIRKVGGIANVSFSTFAPSVNDGSYTDLRTTTNDSQNPDMIVSLKFADTAYFRLYNLALVAGRLYFPADTMREFVVNETVIKNLGIQNPQDAIGKLIKVAGKTCPIVGVVKDFHVNSLRDPIGPVLLTTFKDAYGLANIKIDLSRASSIIPALKNIWDTNFPDYVFEYGFLDQSIAAYYKQENQLSQLYKIFSGIAIFISCLGLYGLISFMAVRRKKEISIRKVLGAPVSDIVVMLSKEFTLLIAIAFLIASPIAWYVMHKWLEQYTFRIPISALYFIATIACSLCIAWFTVGYTAIKAALANPVKSLRTE
jgi:ABC-type antimicrobial peptide transport system permease subunit